MVKQMPLRNFEKVFPGKEKFLEGLKKYQCKDLAAKLGVNQSTISYWKNQYLTKEERQAAREVLLARRPAPKHTKMGYTSLDGELLRSTRINAGLTLRQLADETGIKFQTISDLERGHSKLTADKVDILSSTLARFVDLSYVAGLFDRKSSIGILRVNPKTREQLAKGNGGTLYGPTFLVRVEFRCKYQFLVELIQKVLGVGTLTTVQNVGSSSIVHTYMAWSVNGEKVINQLLPYLKVKRRQAELCLELREMQKVNRKYSSAGLTQDYVDRAEELRTEIIRLNRSAI